MLFLLQCEEQGGGPFPLARVFSLCETRELLVAMYKSRVLTSLLLVDEQAQQTNSRMTGMISPLLPKATTESPMLLETEFAPGMHLFIGATGKLSSDRPGNGGFRIWKYDSKADAAAEVLLLCCATPRHVDNGCI